MNILKKTMNIILNTENEQPFNINDISKKLNINYDIAKQRLNKLERKNQIERVYRGTYCIKNQREYVLNRFRSFPTAINNSYRILIPAITANLFDIKNAFVKIEIEKNEKKDIFITKTRYDKTNGETTMFINQSMRDALNLTKEDFINISNIKKIKPFAPNKQIFINGKIDLKSLTPYKTMKNYNIFATDYKKENNEFLVLWYYTGNTGSKRVVIKRFIEPEILGSILGQLQAEGNKFKNLSKGSPTIIFTNKLVSEHTEFIENLIHIGIPKNIIKIHCYFNPNKISEFNAKKYIKKLLDDNMKVKLHPNPHDKKLIIGIQTSVDRAILAELLLNAMNKLRNYISTNEMLETSENRFAHHFLAKLLTGDGNFNIRTSGNNIVTCGYISDCDQSYRNDYKEILKKFKISVANYDKDGRTYFKCNEKNLYFLYRIEAFKGTKNWFKLLRAIIIKKKKQYLRLQTLNNLQVFTIKDIEDSCNISYLAARQWTRYNRKLGFIKMVDVKDKKYYLTLTKEAIGFLNLIDKCRHEFELEKTILEKSDMNEEFIKRNAVNL